MCHLTSAGSELFSFQSFGIYSSFQKQSEPQDQEVQEEHNYKDPPSQVQGVYDLFYCKNTLANLQNVIPFQDTWVVDEHTFSNL